MANPWADVDACEICGSVLFYIDNGIHYCDNGHEQAGGQQVSHDAEEYGTQGKRTTRKKDKPKVKKTKIYRGHTAYKLFLQAYQHILWKQCYTLIHKKGLPPELWTVVKDLWTLRLAKQVDKLENPPVLGPESQPASTKSESGEEVEEETQNGSKSSAERASNSPMLVETVALCYLGILLMRLAISLGSIYRWIRTEEIPYFRAIRHVPREMKAHMPGEYQRALDTEVILGPDGLQNAIYRICALYTTEFGMSLPAINSPQILFQYMKQLALPLEIYPAVKNLNKILNFPFEYSPGSNFRNRRNGISDPEAQLISLVIVTTKMIYPFDSSVIKRYPKSLNSPAALRIDWKKWMKLHKQGTPCGDDVTTSLNVGEGEITLEIALENGRESELTDADIFKMSGAELDQYMDWYQRTWTQSTDAEDDVDKELRDMFPLKPLPTEDKQRDPDDEIEESQLKFVEEVHAAMKLCRPVNDEEAQHIQLDSETSIEIARPGSNYRLYPTVEHLPDTARAFYEAAAEAACMSIERLVNAVRQTEIKIENWSREKKRTERFSAEGEKLVAED